MQLNICVYCGAASHLSSTYIQAALDLGRHIGQRGHTLVYGGSVRGLMGDVARSVQAHGGRVIGVIPQSLVDLEQAYEGADELIITDGLRERKGVMESRASGFVCLPGGLGTMDELFEALTHRQLRLHNKPILLVNTHDFYQPFVHFIEHIHQEGFVKDTYKKLFQVVPDALSAVMSIEAYQPIEIESRF
jgi:hypothetical protein